MNTHIRRNKAQGDGERKQSPAQRSFRALVRDVEGARARLQAWEAAVAQHHQAWLQEVEPLLARRQAAHREWLFALDRAATRHAWSRADARTLRTLIDEALQQCLDATPGDVELRAMFARWSGKDYDGQRQRRARTTREDVPDAAQADARRAPADADDPDAWEREQAQRAADAAAARAKSRARAEAARMQSDAVAHATDDALVKQSVRDVYRRLASALHPDREPDEQRRIARTAMMQKVNEAYEHDDLLALLEIQLQLDPATIAAIDRPTLLRYNRTLEAQLARLEDTLATSEGAFMREFGVEPSTRIEPARMGALIERARRDVKASIRQLAQQVEWMREPASMRAWLRFEREYRGDGSLDDAPS